MTIDETIKYYLDIADGQDKCAEISVSEHAKESMRESAADHRQLAEWLTDYKKLREEVRKMKLDLDITYAELAEAKRLLKAAVEDMNNGGCNSNCHKCKHCGECDFSERFTWKHTDEALNLLNEEI